MKIKLLTICLLLSSFSAQSNDLKTCRSVANHLNENLIDKANSALKREYQDIKIELIKTYCDINSSNNVRFNYKFKLMNRDYITSEGRKHMYDQLCSKFNQLKPMFKTTFNSPLTTHFSEMLHLIGINIDITCILHSCSIELHHCQT